MSAVLRPRFLAPARTSSSKMGTPVSLFNIVPGRERFSHKHKLFWARSQNKTADAYNSIVTIFNKPCIRRWLEFTGGRVPKAVEYITCYTPDCIKARPVRYWTLLRDGEPFACYSNCVECWLLVVTGEIMGAKHKWSMLYTDTSGR